MMFWVIFLAWLMFNGRVTVEICIIGLLMSAAVYMFYKKFLVSEEQKSIRHWKRIPLYIRYFFVLIREIVKANVVIIKIALAKHLEFEPKIVYFEIDLKEELSRVMLANSITMTPGTITAKLEGNRYCVHCLDESMGHGFGEWIGENSFYKVLKQIEEVR